MRLARPLLALAIAGGLVALLPGGRPSPARAMRPGEGDRRLARATGRFDATAKGAVARIPVPERDLLAFRVHGALSRDDMRAMARLLATAFDARGRIDVLILMREFGGVAPAAAIDRDTVRAMARANRHIRRYAVVGPPSCAAAMIRTFDHLTPVEARTFALAEQEAAWAWVRGGAAEGGTDGGAAMHGAPEGGSADPSLPAAAATPPRDDAGGPRASFGAAPCP